MALRTGRLADPREVADVIALLASPRSASTTGADFVVDGGFLKAAGNAPRSGADRAGDIPGAPVACRWRLRSGALPPGMALVRGHAVAGVHDDVVSGWWSRARRVLDVSCGHGVLRSARPSGPLVVGLDAAVSMLQAHPGPVVRGDAADLSFAADPLRQPPR